MMVRGSLVLFRRISEPPLTLLQLVAPRAFPSSPHVAPSTHNCSQNSVMHSFTLAALGFLGLQLNDVCAFHVPVPVQSSNMRTSLRATEGTSERPAAVCRFLS